MNNSDVFILPSFYEGLPLVLIEAMACGLKTICTDLPGIRPWLDGAIPGSGTIFVAPPRMHQEDEPFPDDLPVFEQALAEAIETIQYRPDPDQKLVRQLSWDALCLKYHTIWNP
jgi:glycosyltransferase involved in cell wall biosynthesis